MTQLWQFVLLLQAHWIGDFVLQTHWQASNKSKRMDALFKHVLSYTATLAVGALLIFGPTWNLLLFITFNGSCHFITDFWTSRWTARLYAKQNWHDFFAIVGLDQLIHQTTLAFSMWSLL